MVMESFFPDNIDYINDFSLDEENTLPVFDQFPGQNTGYRFRDPFDLSFLDSPPRALNHDVGTINSSSQADSPDEFSVYLSSMFHDPFTLQANDKLLYEELGNSDPPQPQPQPPPSLNVSLNVETPEEISYRSSGEYSSPSSISGSGDSSEIKSSITQTHSPPFKPTIKETDAMINAHMAQNIFTDQNSILLFKKGMEEARKFLPPTKPLLIDLSKYNLPSKNPPEVTTVKVENIEAYNIPDGFRARKHHHLEDNDHEDERSSKHKQSSLFEEEQAQLSRMFDRILLCCNNKSDSFPDCHSISKHPHAYNHLHAPSWRSVTKEDFDIRTLLISCSQSVASDDHKIATQQLKQIRQHSSPSGTASQRLAHVFALGLEARLSGTGSQLYARQKALKSSSAEKLKALQVYVNVCPFKKNELYFANRTIYEAAVNSSALHIVDFGIAYGLQWPLLIKHLADRRGGPPKLRITGIDHPEAGFRPAERLEETGRRLASYCRRFHVPFEYNSIAVQNWETVKLEDLKLKRNEFLAVNVLTGFENLLDETVMDSSPRDSVLKKIREMKPDVFVQSVVNGSYSAPFFETRFKEALFHYSGLFDMLDATLERGNVHRRDFEREFYGHEAVNVIACEGRERVERPESYKQWQVRNVRAGFRGMGMNREVVSELKGKVKGGYHKDFVLDDDGVWMLQGWKGRILYASSCWVPA